MSVVSPHMVWCTYEPVTVDTTKVPSVYCIEREDHFKMQKNLKHWIIVSIKATGFISVSYISSNITAGQQDVSGVTSSASRRRESDQRRTWDRAAAWPATTGHRTGPPPPAGLLCWTASQHQGREWRSPAGGSSPPSLSCTPHRERGKYQVLNTY